MSYQQLGQSAGGAIQQSPLQQQQAVDEMNARMRQSIGGIAPRQAAIPQAIESMGESIKDLTGQIDTLNSRLSGVMRTDPPVPTANVGREIREAPACELADRLLQHKAQLDTLRAQLASIFNRLQL